MEICYYLWTREENKVIKPKISYGYEEISNKIKILKTDIFPDRLKYAIVRPIFKKGDIHETSNYRPISLLISFSKIIEKLIYNALLLHLDKNNMLANE
jgi:hypothetical protein